MTPSSLITIFKAITEHLEGIFFAGTIPELLRVTTEAEGAKGKTIVFIDLMGYRVSDDFKAGTPIHSEKFTMFIIQHDDPDSVSDPNDNKGEMKAAQTIFLDCYNFWIDMLRHLEEDDSAGADYIASYFDQFSVNASDAKFFIKSKTLGMMSGIFIDVTAEGRPPC